MRMREIISAIFGIHQKELGKKNMEYPKPKRKVDEGLLDKIRSEHDCCMINNKCFGGLDLHHVTSRGSGGSDSRENCIMLCRSCHQKAHSGKISKKTLYETIEQWYNED
jgi:5-methylcytosine-specific restriction endonuclease McrA